MMLSTISTLMLTRYRGLLKKSCNQIWPFCPIMRWFCPTMKNDFDQVQRPSPRSRHRNLYSFQGQVWEGSNIVLNPDTSIMFSISVQLLHSNPFRILFAGHYLTAEREGGAVVIYYRWHKTSNFYLFRKMILADSYLFTLSQYRLIESTQQIGQLAIYVGICWGRKRVLVEKAISASHKCPVAH